MARAADPAVRMALVETAARVIAEEGPARLTLRRLAGEVGTSTMAVYTHFGSMTDLRREVRVEGFARLGADLSAVEETGDPVADYFVLGWAYYRNATDNPNLYRAMFMEGPVDGADAGVGFETFDQCVAAARRCIEAGRFEGVDATDVATELWAVLHGIASLQLVNMLPPAEARRSLTRAGVNLFKGFGDDPRAVGRSLARARQRISPPPA